MDEIFIESKINNLLYELRAYVEAQHLSSNEALVIESEIDKLLIEYVNYKTNMGIR